MVHSRNPTNSLRENRLGKTTLSQNLFEIQLENEEKKEWEKKLAEFTNYNF